MDFEFTEEQKMLKATVREFLEKEIAPHVDKRERDGPFTREELVGYIQKLMPFGYYIGGLPEEYGGMNLDNVTRGMLLEELSRVWASLGASIFIATSAPGTVVSGPQEMRDRLLPRVLKGDLIGCSAITEPNHGSDSGFMETTAVLDGDEWVINGTKTWISNGTVADIVNVVCVTDKDKGPLGMSSIIVEKERSPFQARELHKLGWYCFPTAELSFIDCHVPKENQAGERGIGYRRTIRGFEGARSMMGVMAVGICQAAVDAAIKFARQRTQFGRPIGGFQLVQEIIFDMVALTEAARFLTYRALYTLDKGERCRWQSSLAKAYACEAAVKVTSKAIEVHGAVGLSDEYPLARYFRDARMLTIPDGTTEIQKLVVGRELLGIRAIS
jgi:alkylation response protein AidB-like acyl-CoA dehydrogenase